MVPGSGGQEADPLLTGDVVEGAWEETGREQPHVQAGRGS